MGITTMAKPKTKAEGNRGGGHPPESVGSPDRKIHQINFSVSRNELEAFNKIEKLDGISKSWTLRKMISFVNLNLEAFDTYKPNRNS